MNDKMRYVLILIGILNGSAVYGLDSASSRSQSVESGINTTLTANSISFWDDVKPILDSRCVVCHSCYDAPCQLKLGSAEGIDRGATKQLVYDGTRLTPAQPTRLFVDAHSIAEWREKKFFPVLDDDRGAQLQTSLLAKMLQLKKAHPSPEQGKLSDEFQFGLNRELQCPKPEEFDDFKKDHALWGMPYAFPGLSGNQIQVIEAWLQQGANIAPGPSIDKAALADIHNWEQFLNQPGLKHQLMSRYLYEHLFLGHLHFQDRPDTEFFTLVRSSTPPGKPLAEIVTDLPYQNPKVKRVYYRFKPVQETIVDKTHFVYELNDQRKRRYQALFLKPDYSVAGLPGYSEERATNPFETFAAIPLDSRYKFLLDDAAYFIGGFIKGPVCKGQVALNVIQDRFWVMFITPEMKYAEQAAHFLSLHSEQLSLPAAEGEDIGILGWIEYDRLARDYLVAKEGFIDTILTKRHAGLTEKDIWDGGQVNSNAALTVFRHYDSATVVKGFVGDFPKTAWVVDYPIFERLHYLLVAGFNVYGTIGHQLATRKYMDYLRIDSENNFLRFMPSSTRMEIHEQWYMGIIPEINDLFFRPLFNADRETGISFPVNADPKNDFILRVMARIGTALKPVDRVNRCNEVECQTAGAEAAEHLTVENALRTLTKINGEALKPLPEISFLKITGNSDKPDLVYTLLVDKDLINLSTLFAEDIRHNPKKDKLTVVPGFVGSYPNFFFEVGRDELARFVSDFATIHDSASLEHFYSQYGIRRTNPKFWEYSDWFYLHYKKFAGIESGLFDFNRYENF